MKSLLILFTFLSGLSAQADFIKSEYLYELKERHESMLLPGGDGFIDIEYKDHGKWVTTKDIISDKVSIIGFHNLEVVDLYNQNRWPDIENNMFQYEDIFFCDQLVKGWLNHFDQQQCKDATKKLLGDALNKADAVDVLTVSGDYYGDWEETVIILSDYKTKETLTLSFSQYHEI